MGELSTRNVRDLYGLACRTYKPGDKIHAFGLNPWFYSNNDGSGRVTVEHVVPPPL